MRTTLDRKAGAREPEGVTDVVLRPAAVAIAILGDGHPHETIAVPGVALAPDDVLVAIELTTVCEDDVRVVQGMLDAPVPLVLGHESVGRIVAIGSAGADAADGTPLRLGDRVVWSATVPCGSCDRCVAGLGQECRRIGRYGHERIAPHRELTGGFASHIQLRRGTTIARVPEALPAAVLAPASCTTARAWAAVASAERMRGLEGLRVRVRGAGLVGVTAAAIAAERGADVQVVDGDQRREDFARRFCGERRHDDGSPHVVIETTGLEAAAALDEVDAGGTVVLVGHAHASDPLMLDSTSIVRRGVSVLGVHDGGADDLVQAVSFLAGRGRAYPFADAVARVRPLADIDDTLAEATGATAPLRVGLVAR